MSAQFKSGLSFQWQMNIRKAEKENQKAPHQHVGADRYPRLAPVRLPQAAAYEFHDHVADVRELVREHQNGDSGNAQRQPGELGMMSVQEDAVLLHPLPDKV